MKKFAFSCLVAAVLMAGCATTGPGDLKPGASADEIRAQMGTPVASYALSNGGKRLEFRGSGARTYMLDVDASGKLVNWVQVLNETNFRNITAGMTREQVLMTLGQPSNIAPGGRQGGEVWSYHFQNTQCQWFQVGIGADGRTTGNGSQALLPACMQAP
jgi:outer membrane protein assembly factor BamE (lipoprotein component of BamABCDE complex)